MVRNECTAPSSAALKQWVETVTALLCEWLPPDIICLCTLSSLCLRTLNSAEASYWFSAQSCIVPLMSLTYTNPLIWIHQTLGCLKSESKTRGQSLYQLAMHKWMLLQQDQALQCPLLESSRPFCAIPQHVTDGWTSSTASMILVTVVRT